MNGSVAELFKALADHCEDCHECDEHSFCTGAEIIFDDFGVVDCIIIQ